MTDIERFWSHVDMRDPSECWPWVGPRNAEGYGRFYFRTPEGGKRLPASRWLLGYLRGEPLRWGEVKEMACHTCDNPPCCNPNHLYVGDDATNQRDMYSRGRGRWGGTTTHCYRGHPYDGYIDSQGSRRCRTCGRAADARYHEKKRKAVG